MTEPAPRVPDAVLLSVVTPAFNEAENLRPFYERLRAALAGLDARWEWVVIDDHSSDGTFAVLSELARQDPAVRAYRLARNSGSHTAIACGLTHARGACAAVMAADLQDPPETLRPLLAKWREGAPVVWAVRERREGEPASVRMTARLYYWIMRRVVGLRDLPPTGADFFLVDRRVIDALLGFGEANVSLISLIVWMGFPQESIPYTKQARVRGASGWTLEKKLKLLVDSVASFSYLPIRVIAAVGFAVAIVGFLYAGLVAANALTGHPVSGWSSLMIVVLIIGGVQMIMMGVLGEYLWRALDEARRRPRFVVEDSTEAPLQRGRGPARSGNGRDGGTESAG